MTETASVRRLVNSDNSDDEGVWLPTCFIISPLELMSAVPEGVSKAAGMKV